MRKACGVTFNALLFTAFPFKVITVLKNLPILLYYMFSRIKIFPICQTKFFKRNARWLKKGLLMPCGCAIGLTGQKGVSGLEISKNNN